MSLFSSAPQLSNILSTQLIEHGKQKIDRFEIVRFSSLIGRTALNDRWNGHHKNFPAGMGRQGPVLFYEAGNTPILWVHQESPPLSTFIFRPSDVALRSLGMNLINKLPKELQQSHEVLVATNGAVIAELDTDPNLAEIVKTLTEPAVSKG